MIYVLLPAYNEEGAIEQLMANIDAALGAAGGYRIIVCNDGSKDGTAAKLAELVRRYPIEVIEHRYNRGLGETIRDLVERVVDVASPNDVVVRMDADVTHDPRIIPRMVAKLAEGYDVVLASRFQPGGGQKGVSSYRAFVSYGANLFMKVFFPIPGIREYSCGFRAYRAEILQRAVRLMGDGFIQLRGLGFTCTLEKLVKLKLMGARFAEVPFVLQYDLKVGSSKMIGSITTLGYIVMTILYHWPFGGWRTALGPRLRQAR
jgi:dolichol-phosphate mannosyltransferase